MKKCYDCAHVEMCGWRKEVKERGCEFFDDGMVWIPCSERLPEMVHDELIGDFAILTLALSLMKDMVADGLQK